MKATGNNDSATTGAPDGCLVQQSFEQRLVRARQALKAGVPSRSQCGTWILGTGVARPAASRKREDVAPSIASLCAAHGLGFLERGR
ncbi:MAG: hypothetical protein JRH07_15635 [Deltaproteobacteria bacterium]|nr:hypothetical protein [Deltaproteobacteria bacterium]MBW2123256.1 hypothetical protein [Deltaproteobacteria bacterium]